MKYRYSTPLSFVLLLFLFLPFSQACADTRREKGFQDLGGIDFYQAHSCGYIRIDVPRTIFNPTFLKILEKKVGNSSFSSTEVRNFVHAYNQTVKHHTQQIVFSRNAFTRIASLSARSGRGGIDKKDIRILYNWHQTRELEPGGTCAVDGALRKGMAKLYAKPNKALANSLVKIARDPVGNILVRNAIKRGVTIQSRSIKGPPALCLLEKRRIIVDKTVNLSELKIKYLVHELVHMANPSRQNSIMEEALAEIISAGVQDRITRVPLSCSPYVVFVDRLMDKYYGQLPLDNGIKSRLRKIGIDIDTGKLAPCGQGTM